MHSPDKAVAWGRARTTALVLTIAFNWLFFISALPWLFFAGAMAGVLTDWDGRTALEHLAAVVLLPLPLVSLLAAILGWRDFVGGSYIRGVLLSAAPVVAFVATVACLRAWSP